jgi:hypothetical protein
METDGPDYAVLLLGRCRRMWEGTVTEIFVTICNGKKF